MFKKEPHSPIGLDLGSNAIKMVQLQSYRKQWRVREVYTKEFPSDAFMENPEGMDQILLEIKRELKKRSFTGRNVISSMPDDQLAMIPVKLTLSGKESIEEALIKQAEIYLNFDLSEAVIDYLLHDGEKRDETKEEITATVRALLVAAKRKDVDAHLNVLKILKMNSLAIDSKASALSRVFRFYGTSNEMNRLVINIDENTTSLMILYDGLVFVDRKIPWGLANIILRLSKNLDLDPDRSRNLLFRVGVEGKGTHKTGKTDKEAGVNHHLEQTVYELITPELEQLAQEIEKVLIYFSTEMRGEEIHELSLLGACSAIHHLDGHLEQHLGITARFFDPFKTLPFQQNGVAMDELNGKGPSLAVALGLAMRGMEPFPVQTGEDLHEP